ncbi:MAG: DUF3842 family protein [Clostridia bacterium]|nr:DUF3842 family protein [Clostridia bacterium]
MRIAVIDGQGGGIGKRIVESLRANLPEDIEIIALATNALAASQMLKAGANEGASGENAVVYNASKVDIIVGTVALLVPNSMLGEMTAKMVEAIGCSNAIKVLIPLNRSNIYIVGAVDEPLPHQIDALVDKLKELISKRG